MPYIILSMIIFFMQVFQPRPYINDGIDVELGLCVVFWFRWSIGTSLSFLSTIRHTNDRPNFRLHLHPDKKHLTVLLTITRDGTLLTVLQTKT